MGSILQEIQLVHSLRKNIRDPKLSSTILASIESIHRCLKTGIDQNGWKTVEWRGSRAPQNHTSQKGYSYGSRGHNGHNNRDTAHSNTSFNQRTRPPEPVSTIPVSTSISIPTSIPASIPLTTVHPPISQKGNGAWHESSDGFRPHQKYVSKFKKTAGKVEDTILNTILLGKLNKFSQPNYNEIKEFMGLYKPYNFIVLGLGYRGDMFSVYARYNIRMGNYDVYFSSLSFGMAIYTKFSKLRKHYIFEPEE